MSVTLTKNLTRDDVLSVRACRRAVIERRYTFAMHSTHAVDLAKH